VTPSLTHLTWNQDAQERNRRLNRHGPADVAGGVQYVLPRKLQCGLQCVSQYVLQCCNICSFCVADCVAVVTALWMFQVQCVLQYVLQCVL